LRFRGRCGLHQPAAVDDESRARHEARAGEVDDGGCDVVRSADAPEQRLGGAPLLLSRLDGNGPRREAADAHLGRERARQPPRGQRPRARPAPAPRPPSRGRRPRGPRRRPTNPRARAVPRSRGRPGRFRRLREQIAISVLKKRHLSAMRIFAVIAVGAALVAAATAAVLALTLTATPTAVVYGKASTLNGVLSTHKANQTVKVDATECGTTSSKTVGTVKTNATGAYTMAVTPIANTTYQATQKNTKSPAVAVTVTPVVKLQR